MRVPSDHDGVLQNPLEQHRIGSRLKPWRVRNFLMPIEKMVPDTSTGNADHSRRLELLDLRTRNYSTQE